MTPELVAMCIKTGLTPAQIGFLRDLSLHGGAAAARTLGPQTSQEENSARQRCKRRGLVVYDSVYWRLTELGREAVQRVFGPDVTTRAKDYVARKIRQAERSGAKTINPEARRFAVGR
jgi:hypothetical protein